jgi:Glycosyl transferases group 1/Glycosyltransferase Family 4
MKTLHVDCGRTMGGGQWQVIYLLERMKDSTLLADEASPLFAEAKARGIDVRPLSLLSLARAARDYDLVHAHDARAHTMAATIPGVQLVVSRRVAFPIHRGILSRVKYARAGLFLAVSRFVSAQLEQTGIDGDRIRVVYDGVPLVKPADGDEIVALASKSGAFLDEVSKSTGLELRRTVDLWHDLAAAKIFVYASGMEGLGSAALAAMSAGVPVIASNVGGLMEAVEHERTGILVSNRVEDFAFALGRLLARPVMAREMGRRGRERVEQNFTVEMMVDRTIAAYHEVLA